MRGAWLLAALLLLGGCGFQSFEPLIAESEQPAAIGGRYEVYLAAGDGELSGVNQTDLKCITAGGPDAVTGTSRPFCRFIRPEDSGDLPPFVEIEPRGTAFVVKALDERRAPEEAETPDVRFLQLTPGIYLVQWGEVEGGRFGYFVIRVIDEGIEVFFPNCRQFAKGTTPFNTPIEASCTADSLAALRPELDAYVNAITSQQEMPLAFLKRV